MAVPSAAGNNPADLSALVAGWQRGDAQAAEVLIGHLTPGLYRFFLAQQATRIEAEDLVQETCLRLHRARHTYRAGEPVLAWVYGIARHIRVDAYRRQQRKLRREVGMDVLPERAGEPAKKETDLEPCLKELPESQREVILMMKVTGMSLEEVARSLGTSIGAVKQKAHRAYASLRECLGRGGRP